MYLASIEAREIFNPSPPKVLKNSLAFRYWTELVTGTRNRPKKNVTNQSIVYQTKIMTPDSAPESSSPNPQSAEPVSPLWRLSLNELRDRAYLLSDIIGSEFAQRFGPDVRLIPCSDLDWESQPSWVTAYRDEVEAFRSQAVSNLRANTEQSSDHFLSSVAIVPKTDDHDAALFLFSEFRNHLNETVYFDLTPNNEGRFNLFVANNGRALMGFLKIGPFSAMYGIFLHPEEFAKQVADAATPRSDVTKGNVILSGIETVFRLSRGEVPDYSVGVTEINGLSAVLLVTIQGEEGQIVKVNLTWDGRFELHAVG